MRAGDPDAFGDLFSWHGDAVYRYCVQHCGDSRQAEDLLSVTFLEAWRLRERAVVADESFRPWLLAIAFNVMRNDRRAGRRHAAALERYHAAHLEDTGDDVVAEAALRAADTPRLRGALSDAWQRLTTKERAVADLCLVGELTPAAAAAELSLPVGTVKSQLLTARRRLRAVLRSSELPGLSPPDGHPQVERRSGARPDRERTSRT